MSVTDGRTTLFNLSIFTAFLLQPLVLFYIVEKDFTCFASELDILSKIKIEFMMFLKIHRIKSIFFT